MIRRIRRRLRTVCISIVLALLGAGLFAAKPADAAFPLNCYRMPTVKPATSAVVCRNVVRRIEERRPDGTIVVVWPTA
jgi:hypothetical protein